MIMIIKFSGALVLMPFVDAARETADHIVGPDFPKQPMQMDQ
jgi:hypothetical protein